MTTVADSSALVASVVNSGSDSRWVDAAFADEDLVCPELAIAEASNILRRMELAGRISHTEATEAYAELLDIDIVLRPFTPYTERIWALRNNLTIYDHGMSLWQSRLAVHSLPLIAGSAAPQVQPALSYVPTKISPANKH